MVYSVGPLVGISYCDLCANTQLCVCCSSSCADDNAGKKPKRSSVPFTRLGLRLLQATGLEARDDIDPFAEVRVESQVTRSQAISKV